MPFLSDSLRGSGARLIFDVKTQMVPKTIMVPQEVVRNVIAPAPVVQVRASRMANDCNHLLPHACLPFRFAPVCL